METEGVLVLFLQNLLIVFTVIKVVRLLDFAFTSTPVIESAEKRLVADELLRARASMLFAGSECPAGAIIGTGDLPTKGSLSQYADDCRNPEGIGGVDENRPKGSGERGMIGDSAGTPGFMLIEGVSVGYPCSTSSSRFRLSVSVDVSEPDRVMGMYDFGADVVTPFNARRGGDGGALWRRGGEVFCSEAKGVAGQAACNLDGGKSGIWSDISGC